MGLFIFNILPITPMDGGMVMKRILSDKFGNKVANRILFIIKIVFLSILSILEIILVIYSRNNIRLIFVLVFLLGNLFTNESKYNMNFLKELLYIKNKSKKDIIKVNLLEVKENFIPQKVAEYFSIEKNYIIYIKNSVGKIVGIKTEEEIIDEIFKNSWLF